MPARKKTIKKYSGNIHRNCYYPSSTFLETNDPTCDCRLGRRSNFCTREVVVRYTNIRRVPEPYEMGTPARLKTSPLHENTSQDNTYGDSAHTEQNPLKRGWQHHYGSQDFDLSDTLTNSTVLRKGRVTQKKKKNLKNLNARDSTRFSECATNLVELKTPKNGRKCNRKTEMMLPPAL